MIDVSLPMAKLRGAAMPSPCGCAWGGNPPSPSTKPFLTFVAFGNVFISACWGSLGLEVDNAMRTLQKRQ